MLMMRTKNVYHIPRKNRKIQFYKQLVIITFVVGIATLFTDFLVEFFVMVFSCSFSAFFAYLLIKFLIMIFSCSFATHSSSFFTAHFVIVFISCHFTCLLIIFNIFFIFHVKKELNYLSLFS